MSFFTSGEVVASAARTATGQSSKIASLARKLSLAVDVTAVSGSSPTCTFSVEWSTDAGTTWFVGETADSFTQITEAGKKVKQFDVKAPHYRLVWTIAGTTPSFTFSALHYLT